MRPKTTRIIIDILDKQNEKGIKNYGTTIDEASNEDYDWNQMALEEAVDLIQYLVKENTKLQAKNNGLRKLADSLLGEKYE